MLDEDDDFPARIEAAESLEEMAWSSVRRIDPGGGAVGDVEGRGVRRGRPDEGDATERAGAEERMRQFRYKGETLWSLIGDAPEAIEASLLQAYAPRDPVREYLTRRSPPASCV
jgi:hypothetical protein